MSEAVDRFQAENQELALVEDEDGDVVGMVTTTGLLESVMDDVDDPLDVDDHTRIERD